ncbi:hypothetical protein LIA77_00451 [Sarocladium implicatum]|nr:hypothetical protein LIA77_00451 [Sarocladium implicatum]
MGNATNYLRSTILEQLEAATALRGPGALDTRSYSHTWSLGSFGPALPSEDSLRYMLFTGLGALDDDGHNQEIVAEMKVNPRDAHVRRLLPLIMAQGLFLFEDEAARALALSLLELEALFVRSELGLLSGLPQDVTRRNIFLRIAAWSGHGYYMRVAEKLHVSYFAVSKAHTRHLQTLIAFQQTHDMIMNDGTPPSCHEPYLLDFELSMVSFRAPALAASATVFESNGTLLSQFQGSIEVDEHRSRQVMLAAEDWLRATAQGTNRAHANSSSGRDLTEGVLEYILVIINKQVYHAQQVLRLAMVDMWDQQEGLSGHEVTTRLWMLRWHQLFLEISRPQETTMSQRNVLLLYSMLWLTVLADVSVIEKSARKEVGQQRAPISAIGREEGDTALLQIHCGQVFRLIRSTERSRPLWWPLAVYRATLLLWNSSLSPQQMGSNGTIDPNLIISADLGPFETWSSSTVAVDQLPLEDDHIQSALNREKDLNATLSLRDGSYLALDDSQGILSYGMDVLDQGPSSLLRDGVLMRLKGMHEAWYGQEEVQMEESSDCS